MNNSTDRSLIMTDNPWLSQPEAEPYPRAFADPLAQRRVDELEATIDQIRTLHDDTIDQHAPFCDSHYKRARDCNCWRAVLNAILEETR